MKNLNFIALIIAFFLFSCGADEQENSDNQGKTDTVVETTVTEVEEVQFTQEQLERYYTTYDNPFVMYIRTSFNNFLGDNLPTSEEFVRESLEEFKEYIENKFIVLAVNDGIAGGKDINIIFPEKADKVFWIWVYELGDNGGFELRSFEVDDEYTEEEIDNLKIRYKFAFEDIEHSL